MSLESQQSSHNIGSINEKPLHAALKEWYAYPEDQFEVSVDGFVVDIIRGDLIVEIQTTNFSAIKRKLVELVIRHPVRLVYPIAREKWLIKYSKNGQRLLGRRKSPKKGTIEHVFEELVSFPQLIINPNFSLEVLLIQEEEVRRFDSSTRRWRRKNWGTHERRLLQVVDQRLFKTPADIGALIPKKLIEPFTTSDLANIIEKPRWLAQKMAYCLREMNVIVQVGKQGNAILYSRVTD